MSDHWDVYKVNGPSRNNRVRRDRFIFGDHPADQHVVEFFVWVLKSGDHEIVADTDFGAAEKVDTGIIPHPHCDRAGSLVQALMGDTALSSTR